MPLGSTRQTSRFADPFAVMISTNTHQCPILPCSREPAITRTWRRKISKCPGKTVAVLLPSNTVPD
jgi:hypothetical protein